MQILCLVLLVAPILVHSLVPGGDIQVPDGQTLIKTSKYGSSLYTIDAPNSIYTDPPYLLDLTPLTAFEQGFDAGYLIGDQFVENYQNLMNTLFGTASWEPLAQAALSIFLDNQWNKYLKLQVPEDFLQEIEGLTAGGRAAGITGKDDVGLIASRGVALANLPGSLVNIKFLLLDEYGPNATNSKEVQDMIAQTGLSLDQLSEMLKTLSANWAGFSCSMFGVWGSRTEGGRLFTGRNLDYLSNSGISKFKLITVFGATVDPSTKVRSISHATIGFSGLWGALTGVSSEGLTMHEANLESDDISYRGFPWVLRLRYLMKYASNIDEVKYSRTIISLCSHITVCSHLNPNCWIYPVFKSCRI